MTDRRQSGSGQMRRDGRASKRTASSGPPSLAGIGADLLYNWKMVTNGSSFITVNGSGNITQLKEIVGGSAHMNAADGVACAYHANAGSNDKPWMESHDSGRVNTAAISIAANNRAGLYVIAKCGNNNGFVSFYQTHTGGAGTQTRLIPSATQYVARLEFAAATGTITVTVPVKDQNWHLFAWRPLATGALFQIDGVTTSPNFASSAALAQITNFSFGFGGGLSDTGAGFHEAFHVNDPTDSKDTIVKQYVAYEYGLTLS